MINQLKEKVAKDYQELIAQFEGAPSQEIIYRAYEIAHYNEINYFFEDIVDEDVYEEETIAKMLNYKGNIVYRVYDIWLDYNHPERYNFFCYEDLVDIIKSAF